MNPARLVDRVNVSRVERTIVEGRQTGNDPTTVVEAMPCLIEVKATTEVRPKHAGSAPKAAGLLTWMQRETPLKAGDLVEDPAESVTYRLSAIQWDKRGRYYTGDLRATL